MALAITVTVGFVLVFLIIATMEPMTSVTHLPVLEDQPSMPFLLTASLWVTSQSDLRDMICRRARTGSKAANCQDRTLSALV